MSVLGSRLCCLVEHMQGHEEEEGEDAVLEVACCWKRAWRVGNFLLLKLTQPKSGEDRNQGGTKQK